MIRFGRNFEFVGARHQLNTDSIATKSVYKWQVLCVLFTATLSMLAVVTGYNVICFSSVGPLDNVHGLCTYKGNQLHPAGTKRFGIDGGRLSNADELEFHEEHHQDYISFSGHEDIFGLLLFIVACISYLPRWTWLVGQGPLISEISKQLKSPDLVGRSDQTSRRFMESIPDHAGFFVKYFCILIFYFSILFGNLYLVAWACGYNDLVGALYSFKNDSFGSFWGLFPEYKFCLQNYVTITGYIGTDMVLCKFPFARSMQLITAVLVIMNCLNMCNILMEIVCKFVKMLIPSIARNSFRKSCQINKNSEAGRLVERLDYKSILILELLLQNAEQGQIVDLLVFAEVEIEREIMQN